MFATPFRPSRRLSSCLLAVLIGLALSGGGSALRSEEPALPVPGVDFTAQRAIISDALWSVDDPDGIVYSLDPDDVAAMASTTKSWTIYVVPKEVEKGVLSLDETVTITSNASSINFAHGFTHSNMSLQTGEQYTVRELLYGALEPSAGDACIVVGEHVILKKYPAFAQFWAPKVRELLFASLMNEYAAEAGLLDTEFENAYGGDHDHDADNTPGAINEHLTTARDMARWFRHAMESQPFRDFVGFRGAIPVNEQTGNTAPYNINVNVGYPGVLGEKGGFNLEADTCVIGQVRRIGREMAVAYTGATSGGSGATLLDYAYGKTFHPKLRGVSPEYGQVIDHDLTALNGNRAASAVVTKDGEAKIVLWNVDHGAQTIEIEGQGGGGVVAPVDDLQVGFGGDDELDLKSPTRDGGSDDGRTIDEKVGTPSRPIVEAEIAHAGEGYLVLATRDDADKIRLSCWAVPVNGQAYFRNGTGIIGTGTDLELERVKNGRVVLGHLDGNSQVVLTSWRIDLGAGEMEYSPLDTQFGFSYGEFDIAVKSRAGLKSRIVVAGANSNGNLRLQSFNISNLGGSITLQDTATFNSSSTFVRVSTVAGSSYTVGGDVFVTARRGSNGLLRVNTFAVATFGGAITSIGGTDSTEPVSLEGDVEIQSYPEGGILIASRENKTGPSATLGVWAIDPSNSGSATLQRNLLVDEVSELGEGPLALCRLESGQAEGDFLLGQNDLFSQELRLEAYRSASRPSFMAMLELDPQPVEAVLTR